MSTATGAHTILVYRWEDENEYNQDPAEVSDDVNKIFGAGETLDSQDRANNAERLYGPFSRATEVIIEQQFNGDWSVDFTLTNTWWLQFVFGEPEVSGTEPPYTHEYTLDSRVPPKSAQIIEEIHYPDGAVHQTVYKGVVASSADIDVSVEDVVDGSLDGFYADEEFYDDPETDSPYGQIAEQPDTEYRPLHFGNSTLRMDTNDDGEVETKALVQDASVSFEGNVEETFELGTRFVAAPQYLAFEPDVDYTQIVGIEEKDEERRAVYGSVAATSPQETIQVGDIEGELDIQTGLQDEINAMTIGIIGAFPDDFSRSNVGDPEEALEDDVTRLARELEVTVESDMENPP